MLLGDKGPGCTKVTAVCVRRPHEGKCSVRARRLLLCPLPFGTTMVTKFKSKQSVFTIHTSGANTGNSHGVAKSVLACVFHRTLRAGVDLDKGGSLDAGAGLSPSLASPAKASVTLWVPCFREDSGILNSAQAE